MENDNLSPCDPATLFLQLKEPCLKPLWKHARIIKGKGSAKFLKTLSYPHVANGRTPVTKYKKDDWGGFNECRGYRYHRIVSRVAVAVWEDVAQRKLWLAYHKATSRLVPIS